MTSSINEIVFVLAGTGHLGTIMYWQGYYWTSKLRSAKMYKSFKAVHERKNTESMRAKRRWDEFFSYHLADKKSIHPRKEYLFIKDIKICSYELLPLGEKTEEDLDEFEI